MPRVAVSSGYSNCNINVIQTSGVCMHIIILDGLVFTACGYFAARLTTNVSRARQSATVRYNGGRK